MLLTLTLPPSLPHWAHCCCHAMVKPTSHLHAAAAMHECGKPAGHCATVAVAACLASTPWLLVGGGRKKARAAWGQRTRSQNDSREWRRYQNQHLEPCVAKESHRHAATRVSANGARCAAHQLCAWPYIGPLLFRIFVNRQPISPNDALVQKALGDSTLHQRHQDLIEKRKDVKEKESVRPFFLLLT